MAALTASLARAIADHQGWPADWDLTPEHAGLAEVMFAWMERVLWPDGDAGALPATAADVAAVADTDDEVVAELWHDRDFDDDVDYLTAETPGFFTEAHPSDRPIILGTETQSGVDVVLDFRADPHLLVAGIAGSGKTDLLRTIIADTVKVGAEVHLVDLRGGGEFYGVKENVAPIASTVGEALRLVEAAADEVEARLARIQEAGVGSNAELPDPEPRFLLIVDEFAALVSKDMVPPAGRLGHNGQTAAQVEKTNAAIDRILGLLSTIARSGRAADVHLVISTQKVAGRVLRTFDDGSLLKQFARVLLGPSSYIERIATLRSGKEIEPPAHDGRRGFGLFESWGEPAVPFETRHLDGLGLPAAE